MLLTGLGVLTETWGKVVWKGICEPDPKADVLGCVGPVSSILCEVLVG